MTEKLHMATKKFDIPTRTGIICFSKNGARTGSGATKISMNRKVIVKTALRTKDPYTLGFDH